MLRTAGRCSVSCVRSRGFILTANTVSMYKRLHSVTVCSTRCNGHVGEGTSPNGASTELSRSLDFLILTPSLSKFARILGSYTLYSCMERTARQSQRAMCIFNVVFPVADVPLYLPRAPAGPGSVSDSTNDFIVGLCWPTGTERDESTQLLPTPRVFDPLER